MNIQTRRESALERARARIGCARIQNQRKTRKGWMEELETKVARKNIQKEVSERLDS